MKKKLLTFTLIALTALASFAGCGDGGDPEDRIYDDDNYWSSGSTDSYGNEENGYGYVCTGGDCVDYGY